MKKHVAILQFPGTNCEYDTQYAFEQQGATTSIVWHQETKLPEGTTLVVVPGGFSYGDYLRSGAIARFAPIMKAVGEFAAKGGKVLGICNGFQILVEAGLLPGALKRNKDLHFVSKFHSLRVENTDNAFLSRLTQGAVVSIPIAHADGSYFVTEDELASLKANGQILVTYCDDKGNNVDLNGSVDSIAGVCNATKNVFGLMPHPERAIEAQLGSTDGFAMLTGLLD
jgi:phosphoribosylformylglycinamidine synthase